MEQGMLIQSRFYYCGFYYYGYRYGGVGMHHA